MANNTISQIQIGGTTYDICDVTARNAIGSDTVSGLAKRIKTLEKAVIISDDGGGMLLLKNPLINRDNPGNSDVWDTTHGIDFRDADGERIGLIRNVQHSNGAMTTTVMALNEKTDGTEVSNYINVDVKRDGTKTFGIGDAAAFRSAIGLARVTQNITASSGIASGSVTLYANACMATINIIALKLSSSLALGGTVLVGTIPEGYRPPLASYGMGCFGGVPNQPNLKVWIAHTGEVKVQNWSNTPFDTSAYVEATVTYAL